MEQPALLMECQIYCQYLIQQNPDCSITQKYQKAHQLGSIPLPKVATPIERWLLWVAGIHPFLTRVADSYSSVVFPSSVLRKKLVLLVAILESSNHGQHIADMPKSSTKMTLLGRCIVEGMVCVAIACMAVMILLPLHCCCVLYGWMRVDTKTE